MNAYVERYRAGEHVQVWKELCEPDDASRAAAAQDVEAVAREIVERSLANLKVLRHKLEDLGYEFEQGDKALVEATTDDSIQVHALEEAQGTLPEVLRAWYRRIRSVDFAQSTNQLRGIGQVGSGQVAGLGVNPVLVFLSISDLLPLQRDIGEERTSLGRGDLCGAKGGRFLPLGGMASNCEPKGVCLPSRSVDPVLYNEGFGDVTFVDELRLAFTWGGFPFWRNLIERPKKLRPVGVVPQFASILPELTKDLVPI